MLTGCQPLTDLSGPSSSPHIASSLILIVGHSFPQCPLLNIILSGEGEKNLAKFEMDSIPSIIGVQILAGLQQKNVHRENTMQKIDGKMVTEIIFSSAIKVKIILF